MRVQHNSNRKQSQNLWGMHCRPAREASGKPVGICQRDKEATITDWNLEHWISNTVCPAIALKMFSKIAQAKIDHNNPMKKKNHI